LSRRLEALENQKEVPEEDQEVAEEIILYKEFLEKEAVKQHVIIAIKKVILLESVENLQKDNKEVTEEIVEIEENHKEESQDALYVMKKAIRKLIVHRE
jgi:hypothetical protein